MGTWRRDTLGQAAAAIVLAERNGLHLYLKRDGEIGMKHIDNNLGETDREHLMLMLKAAKPAIKEFMNAKKKIEENIRLASDELYRMSVHLTDLECAYELVWS
tara:strand:+ start:3731 stop:4039 length:309 start_codon:yes stop_codon:yes gene_type:complete